MRTITTRSEMKSLRDFARAGCCGGGWFCKGPDVGGKASCARMAAARFSAATDAAGAASVDGASAAAANSGPAAGAEPRCRRRDRCCNHLPCPRRHRDGFEP